MWCSRLNPGPGACYADATSPAQGESPLHLGRTTFSPCFLHIAASVTAPNENPWGCCDQDHSHSFLWVPVWELSRPEAEVLWCPLLCPWHLSQWNSTASISGWPAAWTWAGTQPPLFFGLPYCLLCFLLSVLVKPSAWFKGTVYQPSENATLGAGSATKMSLLGSKTIPLLTVLPVPCF